MWSAQDLPEADLVVIIGTSLKVQPFASLPGLAPRLEPLRFPPPLFLPFSSFPSLLSSPLLFSPPRVTRTQATARAARLAS